MDPISIKLLGGEVHMTITEYNHIYVDFSPQQKYDSATQRHVVQEHQRITIRGVSYQGSAHLYRWADGKFHTGLESQSTYERRHSIWLKRSDWLEQKYNNEGPSDSTRDKIITALENAVQVWRLQYPQISEQLFLSAQVSYLKANENKAQDNRDSAYKNYQEAEKTLREARAAREEAEQMIPA